MFERFKAQLGPLPIWAWGLIFGGLVVAFYFWQQQKSDALDSSVVASDNESAAAAESATTNAADLIDGAFTPGTASGSSLAGSSATESTLTDTNSAWLIRAVEALIGKGVSPIAAQTALQKYLEGDALNSTETDLVNRAIQAVGGLPPEGTTTPTAATETTAAEKTISKWQWLNDGTVRVIYSDGSAGTSTLQAYVDAGMPAWSLNQYEYGTYTAPSNKTTVADIASKYGVSVLTIQVLNRWTSIPNLKKGSKVKAPSRKGTAK